MPTPRPRTIVTVVIVLILAVAAYLALTVGARYVQSSDVGTSGEGGRLPERVYRAPENVPTTARYGPGGPVALVFAGTDVRTGLTGSLEHPWITVSSLSGDYRALSAPELPAADPGAVRVAPDGTLLAWAYAGGIVLYDPTTDEPRRLDQSDLGADVGTDLAVGPFSPDGSHLVVYDGEMRVVDVESGEIVATLDGLDDADAEQAVWTPDGTALSYVAGGRLVSHDWKSDQVSQVPTTLSDDATLAYEPSGERLAAMYDDQGVNVVELFDVASTGRLSSAGELSPEGYSQQRLLGFTGAGDVAIVSLNRTTGAIEFIVGLPTEGDDPPTEVTQLPGTGTNWLGSETLELAAEPLAQGSTEFEEPRWPWSDTAKLVAVAVGAVFVLGVYLTRRRRHR